VRWVRDATGRFPTRPYYEANELNDLCEGTVEKFLERKYGHRSYPISTGDLELLLEQHGAVVNPYCDLNQFGANTEGASVFAPNEPTRVCISRALSENPKRVNRYRSTLAHEFGHVVLHGPLFRAANTGELFDNLANSRAAACERQSIEHAPPSNWLEWQAGFVSGALLMPASAVRGKAGQVLRGEAGPPIKSPDAERLILCVVSAFHVSRDAAEVRLQQLGLIRPHHTHRLL
jgi:hypothetical protein